MKRKMPELLELFLIFMKIGACMFGGGYSMLPLLERELVKKRKWTSEEEVADYFAIGQCTPGVIAVNTATFIGFKRRGVLGGIIATLGLVVPSFVIIVVIATFLSFFSDNPIVGHAFAGIRIAVCATVSVVIYKLARSAIKDWLTALIAIASFVLMYFLNINAIFIVLGACLVGILYSLTVRAIKRKNGTLEQPKKIEEIMEEIPDDDEPRDLPPEELTKTTKKRALPLRRKKLNIPDGKLINTEAEKRDLQAIMDELDDDEPRELPPEELSLKAKRKQEKPPNDKPPNNDGT